MKPSSRTVHVVPAAAALVLVIASGGIVLRAWASHPTTTLTTLASGTVTPWEPHHEYQHVSTAPLHWYYLENGGDADLTVYGTLSNVLCRSTRPGAETEACAVHGAAQVRIDVQHWAGGSVSYVLQQCHVPVATAVCGALPG